jgi:ketosteroid isomerase-like protein
MDDPIFQLENDAMERWRQGDPWGFIELGAEDIIYTDVGQTEPITGLDAYREYMRQFEGQVEYQRSEFINPQVVYFGDAALLTFNYRSAVLSDEGEEISHTLWNATEVYFYRGGQWRAVHTHWSFVNQKRPGQVIVPVPVQNPPVKYEGVLAELMTLEAGAMERWRKGDPWGFIEISDEEVTYFDSGTPRRIDGKAALSAEYKTREGKIFYPVMEFIDPQVRACGDMAVLFYRFFSTRLKPDESIESRTPWNCTEVFQRKEEAWRIIHTHWSFIKGERA